MKSYYRLLALAAFVGASVVLLLAFLMQQNELSKLRQAYTELAAKVDIVDTKPSSDTMTSQGMGIKPGRAKISAPRNVQSQSTLIAMAPTGSNGEMEASQQIPKGKGPKPWQGTSFAVNTPERSNSLILKEASVKAVADGLVATMNFSASSNTPLELLAIAVRLPKTSDVRILNFEPTVPDNYNNVQKRVSENGKFAIFMGNMKDPSATGFNLALSGSETAEIRGSCGIKSFMMEVNSSGTTIQPYE
jgi:hypothetical protein